MFESGLAYIRKGATTSGIRLSGTEINSIKFAEIDYLQLPVMIGYKFNIGNHFSIKPSVGGYYAVGVGGYALIDGVDAFNQPYTERTSTFSGTNGTAYRPCNRNDGGLAFALNIGYRNFSIKAEYDLDLRPQPIMATASNGLFRCRWHIGFSNNLIQLIIHFWVWQGIFSGSNFAIDKTNTKYENKKTHGLDCRYSHYLRCLR